MDNINDIIASLTPDDIKSLKETAEAIFGNSNPTEKNHQPYTESTGINNNYDFSPFLNPDMISKIAGIMSAMNSDGGKRCKLIEALKPNLSYQRQKKADEAMQILRLLEMLPLITNIANQGD